MKEDKEDGQGTDVLHEEDIDVEVATTQRTPVGELVAHNIVRHCPPDEDTCEEADNGQEDLTGDEVEPVEQRLAEERQTVNGS